MAECPPPSVLQEEVGYETVRESSCYIQPSTTSSSLATTLTEGESEMSRPSSVVLGGQYGSEGFPFRRVSQSGPPGSYSPNSKCKHQLLEAARNDQLRLSSAVRASLEAADSCISSGNNKKAIPHLEAVLEGSENPELHALVWRLLGNAHFSMANFKKASVCHLHCMAFCREIDDIAGLARANCNIGISYMQLGAFKLAGRCFIQYLDISRLLNNETGIASACSNLGVLSKTVAVKELEAMETTPSDLLLDEIRGHLYRAISYFEEHLSIVEQFGDLPKVCRAYGNIGQCYEMLQQYPQAIFCHRKRMEIAHQLGDRLSEARAICNIGNALRLTGSLKEAQKCYLENLECSREIRDLPGESIALLNLGTITESLGDLDKAASWYTMYLAVMSQQGSLDGQVRAYHCLGTVYQAMKDHRKAQDCFEQLAALSGTTGDTATQTMAKQCADAVKKEAKEERKKKKGLRGTLRRLTKGTLRMVDPSMGHRSPVYQSEGIELQTQGDSPMIRRRSTGTLQQGTWSPGLKRWYHTSPMPDWIPRRPSWDRPIPGSSSPLVIHNRRAFIPRPDNGSGDSEAEVEVELHQTAGEGVRGPLPHQQSSTANPLYLEDLLLQSDVYVDPQGAVPTNSDVQERDNIDDDHPYSAIQLQRTDTVYSRVGTSRHAETLKKLTDDISQPSTELGFHDVTDEWKGWVLAGPDDDDADDDSLESEPVDVAMFEPSPKPKGKASKSPNSSPSSIPKSLDIFKPLSSPKCGKPQRNKGGAREVVQQDSTRRHGTSTM